MEFVINTPETKNSYHLSEVISVSKEQLQISIANDFNKSVANILGLVSLLDAGFSSDQDLKEIHGYISAEATNLDVMVKKLCA